MNKKIFFSLLAIVSTIAGIAQQLPLNTCGIVNTYDASGNRLKRIYFCNNGIDPYPAKMQVKEKNTDTEVFQQVDALYPNPTTGKFSITFSKALNNAKIYITDASGKVIRQYKANGYKVDFNLSFQAAGVYFVRIEEKGNVITKKVVKQ